MHEGNGNEERVVGLLLLLRFEWCLCWHIPSGGVCKRGLLASSTSHQASLTVLTRRGAWWRVGGTLSEPPVIVPAAMGPVGLILSNGSALAT